MLDSPEPLEDESIDILAALDNITSNEGYTFFEEMVRAVNKLKDPHTQFDRPCLTGFYFTLPFGSPKSDRTHLPHLL